MFALRYSSRKRQEQNKKVYMKRVSKFSHIYKKGEREGGKDKDMERSDNDI